MEYFLGSLITLAVVITVNIFLRKKAKEPMPSVRYSQSHVFDLISPFLPEGFAAKQPKPTQSSKHMEEISMRVVFIENKAYWIKDGTFYVARVVHGQVDHGNAQVVDTMAMDKVQLDKIMLVVEKLTEGKTNDSRDSG